MKLEDIPKLGIKGFLPENEATRLFELAREASRNGPCLEIGSYCGLSSLFIGLACQEAGSVLFSIDHHRGNEEQQPGWEYHDPDLFDPESGQLDTFPFFRKAIEQAGLEDTVVPLVARSQVVARQWATPLSLVFIDGGHSLEAAMTDYVNWAPHVMPGGLLAIHDIFEDPAKGGQAPFHIYGLAKASGLFEALPMTGSLGVLQKKYGPISS